MPPEASINEIPYTVPVWRHARRLRFSSVSGLLVLAVHTKQIKGSIAEIHEQPIS
jgi:hypothetical protein